MMRGATHQALTRPPLYRPVMLGLAVILLALAGYEVLEVNAAAPWYLASDIVKGYLPGVTRFIDTGSPYLPAQVAGPYDLGAFGPHTFIHPPAALPLFAAFLVVPLPLWWVIPLGVTSYCVARLRPAPWTWPLMALALCWPRSTGALLTGNSDMWAMAAVAAGAVWGWPIVLLAVKPTFAVLGLVAVRRRSAWIAAVALLPLVALTVPLWIDWWSATRNAGLSPLYSLVNVPLVAIPGIAWLGRSRRAPEPDQLHRAVVVR